MASSRDAIWSSLRLSASSLMMYENNSKLEGSPNNEHCLSDLKAGERGERGHGRTHMGSASLRTCSKRVCSQLHASNKFMDDDDDLLQLIHSHKNGVLAQKMLFGTHFRLQIYCISANKAPTAPLLRTDAVTSPVFH